MTWNPVHTAADIEDLMRLFGEFHDGCLREVHIWTETYVEENLSMSCPSNLDTRARLLIQRQVAGPAAIELLFEQVTGFHMSPDDRPSIIYGATMELAEGVFFWSDGAKADKATTWVTAKEVSWRDASEWMGERLRYGPHETG